MDGLITGENDERVGLSVIDNNDVEHVIEMEFDGEIKYHEQDGYPDEPLKRTNEGAEHVNQARRYAKWHVYRERGYETVPPTENPDSLLAACIAVARLSETAFEDAFGDIEAQIRSHYDDSTVELPFADADGSDILVYKKDIAVRPDPMTFDPPVLEQFLGQFSGDSDSPVVPAKADLDREVFDDLDFELKSVSGMHYLHNDGYDNERTVQSSQRLGTDPDATVEMIPVDPAEFGNFQHYVTSNLIYQARDVLLRMGVKPPIAFRAQGQGKYRATLEQQACPQYENYWDATADIQSWEPK
ncbi:hypothetical protein C499_00550 [Halogeometricum borinquense DSM 11551]|uniref:Uncharacterized protein n=1 Tax=Halogeometricum borinquense (strain ATCC 700274 / DSM 11551 / JCM 10706 / KCTC 4070 / PR3) TaxID=469382 RepID=E4NVW7_HALBP|nr:hypothetical protein [Halogeometricum borinquense]ADQ69187.1 hypothetical protein Hbor_38730 [Halogeometricum borinquense DSM 11551]ELY31602.1 hypothetical protein C499_00550 [Halogeometricum borinquense DSM 11551]